ncbi:hypothetical protein HNR55_002285 [Acetobacter lovaniensis]|uniref:Uncharacterized protein n=1 Tax=Acetobacter lovaniensis TaxID=104100 RepID=A0A841QFC5_9PROT|nr:hypothetical protein [Acetobacter lovaniensis]
MSPSLLSRWKHRPLTGDAAGSIAPVPIQPEEDF